MPPPSHILVRRVSHILDNYRYTHLWLPRRSVHLGHDADQRVDVLHVRTLSIMMLYQLLFMASVQLFTLVLLFDHTGITQERTLMAGTVVLLLPALYLIILSLASVAAITQNQALDNGFHKPKDHESDEVFWVVYCKLN